jgi:hypothetical protein
MPTPFGGRAEAASEHGARAEDDRRDKKDRAAEREFHGILKFRYDTRGPFIRRNAVANGRFRLRVNGNNKTDLNSRRKRFGTLYLIVSLLAS